MTLFIALTALVVLPLVIGYVHCRLYEDAADHSHFGFVTATYH